MRHHARRLAAAIVTLVLTTTIPATMRKRLEKGLSALVGRDAISHLRVEFKRATLSSLDYEVLADFKGSVAASYEMLNRAIQSILVETCNEMGWVIPFTQVTLHQAPPRAQPPPAQEEAPEPVPVFTMDNS